MGFLDTLLRDVDRLLGISPRPKSKQRRSRASWDKLSRAVKVRKLEAVGVSEHTAETYAGIKWRDVPKHMRYVLSAAMRGKPVNAKAVRRALR